MDQIDAAMRRFGMPVGPIELIQQVGIAVAQHAGRVLLEAFPDRLQGSAILEKLKPDQAFYLGEGKGRAPNPAVLAMLPPSRGGPWSESALQERLVMAMLNEAAWALGEGVVATPQELDLAMVFGTGFAPFRGGLLRHADALGTGACAEAIHRLQEKHGRRFTPAPLLGELARSSRGFYPV